VGVEHEILPEAVWEVEKCLNNAGIEQEMYEGRALLFPPMLASVNKHRPESCAELIFHFRSLWVIIIGIEGPIRPNSFKKFLTCGKSS
jgi:hypothetical protein